MWVWRLRGCPSSSDAVPKLDTCYGHRYRQRRMKRDVAALDKAIGRAQDTAQHCLNLLELEMAPEHVQKLRSALDDLRACIEAAIAEAESYASGQYTFDGVHDALLKAQTAAEQDHLHHWQAERVIEGMARALATPDPAADPDHAGVQRNLYPHLSTSENTVSRTNTDANPSLSNVLVSQWAAAC